MKIYKSIIILTMVVFFSACTNLDEKLYDKVSSADYGKTPSEIETIVGRAYASLRGFSDEICNAFPTCEFVLFLSEATSDEACIPTRGADWYDGGRYQEAQFHTWTPSNLLILSSWRYCYGGINKINLIIDQVEKSELSKEEQNVVKAELRGVRAYFYYMLLDLYGNVPINTKTTDEGKTNAPKAEVYEFVETELNEILDLLPSAKLYGRFTQNVANTLLARLYINSEVFIGKARWQDCIDACDRVKGYSLEANFFANFLTENEGSNENIWVIPYDSKEGTVGNFFASLSFHYKQKQAFSATSNYTDCVNGISAQPGLYSAYSDNDIRKQGYLEGDQISMANGSVILMDDGTPLSYTENIIDYTNARQNEGVRIKKYEVKEGETWERDHDFVLMRYAEILLMKAECLVRRGNPDLARPLLEQIRTRAKIETPASINIELIDKEWMFEFAFEGLRRSVNIRMGDWFNPWWNKDATSQYRSIFPIPQYEIDLNSKLVQNPGY
ncbi:MAG TPA: RagB/SusD family nutrient uptake outer membrane protein [Prolixibacteraceae bacterium]|nr:RagB/SusD family nutrient uptake outer membrane protein [Prolixibacteraceae bacterium]